MQILIKKKKHPSRLHAPHKTEYEPNDFEEFTPFRYARRASKFWACITIELYAETRPDYTISGLVHRHVLKENETPEIM